MKALARRGDVAGLVAAAGFQDLTPAPGGGMADRGVDVRKQAILALGEMGPEAGAEAVTNALSDKSDAVRLAAIRVLYARQEATPLAAALAWLPRDRGHARRLAMKALAELRRPSSAPALAAALVHAPDDDPVGEDELLLLTLLLEADDGSVAAGQAVEQLLVALGDERDAVCDRAEELLALIAPLSIEGVVAELNAGAVPHRAAAVLARVKDTRALEPLIEGLRHRDARVRVESAAALRELRDPAAVEAFIHATRDSDRRVRCEAAAALDELGMVALVVGVASLLRPMIFEAVTGVESNTTLPAAEPGHEAANGAIAERSTDALNGATSDQTTDATKAASPDAPGAVTAEVVERLLTGPAAEMVERLLAGPDDVTGIDGLRS